MDVGIRNVQYYRLVLSFLKEAEVGKTSWIRGDSQGGIYKEKNCIMVFGSFKLATTSTIGVSGIVQGGKNGIVRAQAGTLFR